MNFYVHEFLATGLTGHIFLHLWIAGDLECSQSQALKVLVDQRAGDYGRLILNPEFMKQVGAARAVVTEKQPPRMAEGTRLGHSLSEGEQSSSLTQPRRVLKRANPGMRRSGKSAGKKRKEKNKRGLRSEDPVN